MRVTYDPDVDALYIRLLDGQFEVTTSRLTDDVAVDFAPDGEVVGIEVLDASRRVFAGNEQAITLENLRLAPQG